MLLLAYVVRRILVSVLILILASIIIFVLVDSISNPFGLPSESPLYVRYAAWAAGMLQGDLGTSFYPQTSVNSIIAPRVWPTILLMGSSLMLTVVLAVPFGIYAAIKKHGAPDNFGRAIFFAGHSIPDFWLGAILQLVLGIYLMIWAGTRIFYTSGMSSFGGGGVVDLLQHLTLPVVTLSLASIARFIRFQRGAMIEVLSENYIRTARAKGLRSRSVYLKHALRNALLPTITLFALSMGTISGGAVVVETVFSWPGLGFLLIDSLIARNYEVIRALLMINAVFIVLFNLVADLSYAILDPRTSYG